MAGARRSRSGSGGGTTAAAAATGAGGSEISSVISQITKQYGGGVIAKGGSIVQPGRIPLDIFTFDLATLGGIPHNRISMFVGQRSSGKTTAALRAARGAQMTLPDQAVAFLDVEGTYDPVWAEKLGVDNSALYVVQPETGEAAVDIGEALLRTKDVSLLVVDSLAALVPMKEIEDSAEDQQVGLQARMIGKMVRKITAALIAERNRGHYVTVLFINQYRTKIGGWSPTGDPISLPGGRAVEFCTSLQATFKNKENMSKDERGSDALEYNEHAFMINKNKLNAGIRAGEYQMMRRAHDTYAIGEGDIDDARTMLMFAKKHNVYTGGGRAWNIDFMDYSHKVGSEAEAIQFLYDNPEVKWALRCHLIALHAQDLGMPESFWQRFYE